MLPIPHKSNSCCSQLLVTTLPVLHISKGNGFEVLWHVSVVLCHVRRHSNRVPTHPSSPCFVEVVGYVLWIWIISSKWHLIPDEDDQTQSSCIEGSLHMASVSCAMITTIFSLLEYFSFGVNLISFGTQLRSWGCLISTRELCGFSCSSFPARGSSSTFLLYFP